MNRRITYIAVIIIAIIATGLIVGYLNFPFFDRVETPMAEIYLGKSTLFIKLIESGATTQDHVEVSAKRKNGDEIILANIVRMNYLAGYEIVNDSLAFTLRDTVFASNKPHVFKVSLEKISR